MFSEESRTSWNTRRTVLTGIANPMFSLSVETALLMPMSLPVMSSRAPPLFPWLMAASVWSRPL